MVDIKDFKPRIYQESILNTCAKNNTLIVLPTGLGKTKTAILIAVHRLNTYPQSKILFLTPTKPLAAQIQKEFTANTTLDKDKIKLFTGMIIPEDRERLWEESKVIVSTPQGCANDIISKKISLDDVSCLILDEAHHALGNYDYCFIAKNYVQTAKYPRVIGLTASPGADTETIQEICKNMFIESIETRTHEDDDVKPYVQETNIEYILVDLPDDIKEIRKSLQTCLNLRLQKLKDLGLATSISSVGKGILLNMQTEVRKRIFMGEKNPALWASATTTAEAIKIYHALELTETQGITSLSKYMGKVYQEADKTKTKATKNIAKDEEFKKAYLKTKDLSDKHVEHPKLAKLIEITTEELEKNPNSKIIVFNNYRDSGLSITNELNKLPNVDCKLFVGQAKKGETGMSQKEQLQMLEEFRQGLFNIIVATSIGEEGLDIASVNLVLFYEPVPSAIRSIQRKGRTARLEKGAVKILVTKNTRDEAYRWTSYHKEKKMHRILDDMKNNIKLTKQQKLGEYSEEQTKIYADTREANSGILKELSELGMNIKLQQLNVGDFLISDRVCVERKELNDFINSIIDKRLLQQAKALKDNFERPILILEGTDDIYSLRNIHPNAIRGMLATIAVDYGIPIVRTKDYKDTAALLKIMAKHEQEGEEKDFGIRTERKPLTTKEQQEFIVESLPGVGPALAKSLLKEFKTVKNIANAKDEELQKIDKVGKKKAAEIRRIIEESYEED